MSKNKKWHNKALELFFTTNKSWRQIAKELGKPKSTVSDYLRKVAKRDDYLHDVSPEKNKPKILIFDIETSKIKCYTWGLFNQNISIDNIIEDWYVICWSAKFLGEDAVMNSSVHHYDSLEEIGRYRFNERYVIEAAWKVLDDADVVVAHNLKAFDKKKMNAKFLEYGLPEPSPYRCVDTLQIVKGNFKLTSNKLDFVAKMLEQGGKHKTNDQLWLDCMDDNEEALDRMQLYCDNDVTELEDVYLKVRMWDKNAPNLALYYTDDHPRCNGCGSIKLTPLPNKTANTNLSSFSIVRCDNCGKILRDRENLLSKEKRKSLLMNVQ